MKQTAQQKQFCWLKNCTFIQGLIVCRHCSVVFLNKAMLAKTVIVQETSGGLWKLHEETQDVKNFRQIMKICHDLKE